MGSLGKMFGFRFPFFVILTITLILLTVSEGRAFPISWSDFLKPSQIPSGWVILSPEKYKELLEKANPKGGVPAKFTRPRSIQIQASLDKRGDRQMTVLKVLVKYSVSLPLEPVQLGFQKTQLLEATNEEGKTPYMDVAEDQLIVVPDRVGDHQLRLTLEAPVTPKGQKGSDLGFDFGLCGTPVTVLNFDLPSGVKSAQLSTRNTKGELETESVSADRFKAGVPLGTASSVSVVWEDQARRGDSTRSSETETTVTFTDTAQITESRIRLRGTALDWSIQAPANAELTLFRYAPIPQRTLIEFNPERAPTVTRPEPTASPIWKILFRENPPAEFLVVVNHRQARPRPVDPKYSGPYAVGNIAPLDAGKTPGVVRISAPNSVKINPNLKGDTRREIDETTSEVSYRYLSLPQAGKTFAAPLEVTLQGLPAAIQAKLRYRLELAENEWRLSCEATIIPSRTEVEWIDWELPAPFRPVRILPADAAESLGTPKNVGEKRILRSVLVVPRKTAFTITLEATAPLASPLSSPAEWKFAPPRPLNINDLENDVVVVLPPNLTLWGGVREIVGDQVGNILYPWNATGVQSWSASLSRRLGQIHLHYGPQRPNLEASSVLDVDLVAKVARMQQTLNFQLLGAPPTRLRLAFQSEISNLSVSQGTLSRLGERRWEWTSSSAFPSSLVLRFSQAIDSKSSGSTWEVPQAHIEGLHYWENRVRLWGNAQVENDTVWEKLPPEVVPQRPNLPALVVASVLDEPLRLKWEATEKNFVEGSIRFERVWVQTRLQGENYELRCRFVAREVSATMAEFQLPTQAKAVQALINGKLVTPLRSESLLEDQIWQVALPKLAPSELVVVEWRYTLPEGAGTRLTLNSPIPRGGGIPECRWSMERNSAFAILLLSGGRVEERLDFSSGLPKFEGGTREAELEEWLLENPLALENGNRPLVIQAPLGEITFVKIRYQMLVALASGVSFFVVLILAVLRQRITLIAFLLAVIVALWGMYPQAVRTILVACLPGFLSGFVYLLIWITINKVISYRKSRVPTFSRNLAALDRTSTVSGSSERKVLSKSAQKTVVSEEPWSNPAEAP